MESQKTKILELLEQSEWVCTSAMYACFMSDPRRRICDLKEKGYLLESRKCQSHDYHRGGSKEWHLKGTEPMTNAYLEELRKISVIEGQNLPSGTPFRVGEAFLQTSLF